MKLGDAADDNGWEKFARQRLHPRLLRLFVIEDLSWSFKVCCQMWL